MFVKSEQMGVGNGNSILINKPNKSSGTIANLRPIGLLSKLFRKILSTNTLNGICLKVEEFLFQSDAAFRLLRSTSDIDFAHEF